MRELVFLLEEPSAKAMLESLLPRMLREDTQFRCIPFEGKQDLEKQLMRKIRGYQNEHARFIVLRDQDSHPDCIAVKNRLLELCTASGKADRCLVRIACRELETFYLADLQAVEQALEINGLVRHQLNRKFREPDGQENPSRELKALTGNRYEKIAGSRVIGKYLQLDNTRSPSFRNLIAAIQRCETSLLQ
ncbi:MAG: hypothetical protein H6R19_373, partial [Proteobacteria bacterium]|nr:hypothetical protein [Pseudomonadota bacterium]